MYAKLERGEKINNYLHTGYWVSRALVFAPGLRVFDRLGNHAKDEPVDDDNEENGSKEGAHKPTNPIEPTTKEKKINNIFIYYVCMYVCMYVILTLHCLVYRHLTL